MTTTEVSRTTRRTVNIPDHVQIILAVQYAFRDDAKFRVTRITETVEDDGNTQTYTVECSGPRLTSKGAEHATQRGEYTWSSASRRILAGSTANIPDAVEGFLVGRGMLLSASVEDLGEI